MSRQHTSSLYLHTIDSTLGDRYDIVLSNPIYHVMKINIKKVVFPLSYYIFDNETITFDEGGGGDLTFNVNGSYDVLTLKPVLEAGFNGAGALTYTVTFDTATFLCTISATGVFGMDFTNGPSCQLGFVGTYSAAATYTGTNAYNLSGPIALYLKSNALSGGAHSDSVYRGSISNVICAMPISDFRADVVITNYFPATSLYYVNNRPTDNGEWYSREERDRVGKEISSIDLQLVDESGNVKSLNGRHIAVDIEVVHLR